MVICLILPVPESKYLVVKQVSRFSAPPALRGGVLTTGLLGNSLVSFKDEEIEARGGYLLTIAMQSEASQGLGPELPNAKEN